MDNRETKAWELYLRMMGSPEFTPYLAEDLAAMSFAAADCFLEQCEIEKRAKNA